MNARANPSPQTPASSGAACSSALSVGGFNLRGMDAVPQP